MYKIARFISFVFGPPIVPVYGVVMALWLTALGVLPLTTRMSVVTIVALMVCVLPLLGIWSLWKFGVLSDPVLKQQKERTLPYIITLLGYTWLRLFSSYEQSSAVACDVHGRSGIGRDDMYSGQ